MHVDERDRPQLPLVVAITGASGAPYAVRLLQVLKGREVHLVISPSAVEVLAAEVDIRVDLDHFDGTSFHAALHSVAVSQRWGTAAMVPSVPTCDSNATWLKYQHHMNWNAGIASGSFLTGGMVVCPCSMSTLAAIANGLSTNLIQRAADVHLKERRPLILVPRETPLNLIQLENMAQCSRAGATVLPAMPGWYKRPQSLLDLIDFVVARICDHLGIAHGLTRRWGS